MLLIYCKGNREGAVLGGWEAVHSRLMHKYGIDITSILKSSPRTEKNWQPNQTATNLDQTTVAVAEV